MIIADGLYDVSTWDHEGDGWDLREGLITGRRVAALIRELLDEGWDDPSILVERKTPRQS